MDNKLQLFGDLPLILPTIYFENVEVRNLAQEDKNLSLVVKRFSNKFYPVQIKVSYNALFEDKNED